MSRSTLYLLLAVAGTVLPWIFFFHFFRSEGPGGDFAGALFANGAAGGFSVDLLFSSAVFWLFLFREGRRVGLARPWLYVGLNVLVGLSCALPLFLWARERAASVESPPHGSTGAPG